MIIDILITLTLLSSGIILYAKGYYGESLPLFIAGLSMAVFVIYVVRRK